MQINIFFYELMGYEMLDDNLLKILILGGGKMGMSIAECLAKNALPHTRIVVIDPKFQDRTLPENSVIGQLHGAADLPSPAQWVPNYVIVALKPQVLSNAVVSYRPWISQTRVLISVAAGITIETLRSLDLGAAQIVRSMPNTPIAIGQGTVVNCGGHLFSKLLREKVSLMMAPMGTIHWLDNEEDIDAITAVSGSGPAYVYHFVEALAAASHTLGIPRQLSDEIARKTVIGAARMLETYPVSVAQLRNDVTSPSGTTEAALNTLMKDGNLSKLMTLAVKSAHRRAQELSENAN